MKISWIKYGKDDKSFKIPEIFGYEVFKLDDPEQIDMTIKKLVKDKYSTLVITNEIAGFSENIIKKYRKDKEINIIITGKKE